MIPYRASFYPDDKSFRLDIDITQDGDLISLVSSVHSLPNKKLMSSQTSSKIMTCLTSASEIQYGISPASSLFEGHREFHGIEPKYDKFIEGIERFIRHCKIDIGDLTKVMRSHKFKATADGHIHFSFVIEEYVEARCDLHFVSNYSATDHLRLRGHDATRKNVLARLPEIIKKLIGNSCAPEDVDVMKSIEEVL
jgi:hypothetical protein